MKPPKIKKHKAIIREFLNKNNNVILASDLVNLKVKWDNLPRMVKSGELIKIERGIYASPGVLGDDLFIFQTLYKKAIFSHGTALYYHDLVDRNPIKYTVTVPQQYNATSIKESGQRIFFIKPELHELGITTIFTEMGNRIKVYNRERSLCDIVKYRSKVDIQLINEAYKNYFRGSNIKVHLLNKYSKKLNVSNLVTEKIKVLY